MMDHKFQRAQCGRVPGAGQEWEDDGAEPRLHQTAGDEG